MKHAKHALAMMMATASDLALLTRIPVKRYPPAPGQRRVVQLKPPAPVISCSTEKAKGKRGKRRNRG